MSADKSYRRTFGDVAPSRFPGERLGLPVSGKHSVARVGRRFGALFIDLAIAAVISWAFFDYNGWASTLIFVGLQIIAITVIGGSIGHRLVGMRVITLTGQPAGLWRPVVRSVLLGLAIPAMVWDSDQRGFHDKVAGTVLIRA
ncbi:RDD family protein [Homoserinimonas sp. OAct 916]|uniref:RDD family protein n=1 Tax=Homoserinimonas sp. OAct 916 TaxID=2211450 RepID=UPI000DBE4E41|nr:RDD family protein [Homoserinimonas sp. OAct 916]